MWVARLTVDWTSDTSKTLELDTAVVTVIWHLMRHKIRITKEQRA